jgi:hypothetical protein
MRSFDPQILWNLEARKVLLFWLYIGSGTGESTLQCLAEITDLRLPNSERSPD